MNDADNKKKIDVRAYWLISCFCCLASALQVVLPGSDKNILLSAPPFYLHLVWSLISLLLVPTLTKQNLHWPTLSYLLLLSAAVVPFILGPSFFKTYLIISASFILYLTFKNIRQFDTKVSQPYINNFFVAGLTGTTVNDWLLRLSASIMVAGLFSPIVEVSNLQLSNLEGPFFRFSSPISILILILLSLGIYFSAYLLIIASASANFIFLSLMIFEINEYVFDFKIISIIREGGWLNFIASVLLIFVSLLAILKKKRLKNI